MSEPQKLHPISYFNGIINAIKQNIVVFFIFIIFQLKDFDYTNPESYLWIGIVFVFFFNIIHFSNCRNYEHAILD